MNYVETGFSAPRGLSRTQINVLKAVAFFLVGIAALVLLATAQIIADGITADAGLNQTTVDTRSE